VATNTCTGSSDLSYIIHNAADVTACCDPTEPTPLKLGEFQIQIFEGEFDFLDPDTINAVFTSQLVEPSPPVGGHTLPSPVRLSVPSGGALALSSNTIEVLADNCFFSTVDVSFLAEVVGRRKDDHTLSVTGVSGSFSVTNTCPPAGSPPAPPQLITEAILGEPVTGFDQFARDAPTGVPTSNPNPAVPPQVPIYGFTETFQTGLVVVDLDQQQIDAAFEGPTPLFPQGAGAMGYTIYADSSVPMMPGSYVFAWQCVEESVPLQSTEDMLTYSFLADRDSDPANNFRAQAPFQKDPVDDTDTWYLTQYDPLGGGWRLNVLDAQTPGFPMPMTTSARVIFSGQVQFFVVPLTDFGSPLQMLVRYSTFAHEGDFGQTGGPWSGDATAPVGEPLISVSLDPSF